MMPQKAYDVPRARKDEGEYVPLGMYRSAVALAFVIVGIWYLNWRIPTLAPDAPIFSGLLYGAELFGFVSALLHIFMTWRLTVREPPPCTEGLSVDVFVPTYNEPVDIVRKTLLAAKHMDYPHETWLLDDGNRQEMRALAEYLGIHYLARTHNDHAKAGNLNNAMANSKGDFIAIFDADHAPQRNFLTRTLGYFDDASVAFVQTPQDFFNLDSYQHRLKKKKLWTEQALFFKVIQRGKDYWNSAFFCGCCAVVRRSALEKVGGFAVETVTEDLHTSIKLHQAGYRSIYHAESLAYGIAPDHVTPFFNQRVRWGQGAMQVLKAEKLLIFDRRLTIAQKLNYLASILTYFDGWQKGIYYVAPAIVLLTGVMPIVTEPVDFLVHFIPFYILSFIMFEEIGRGYGGSYYIAQYNFARFAAFVLATLGLFLGKTRFNVTPKVRDQATKSRRLLLPQTGILMLNTGAVPFGFVLAQETHSQSLNWIYFNIFWAAVNCAVAFITLSFTRNIQKFLREEYRFPIPLPVVLRGESDEIYGTIDNVSIGGCRIYAPLPDSIRNSEVLRGEIYLPSGPLAFEAQITNEIIAEGTDQAYLKAIGCRFLWADHKSCEALELFLYGTDTQWKLLGIKETGTTPLQWLKRWVSSGAQPGKTQTDEHWATCRVINDSALAGLQPLLFGLIPLKRDNVGPRQLVTFLPLPVNTRVRVQIFTRTKQMEMVAKVSLGEYLENSAGPMYLYPVSESQTIGIKNHVLPEYPVVAAPKARSAMAPLLQLGLRPALRTMFLATVLLYLFVTSSNLWAAEEPSQVFLGSNASSDNSYAYLGHVAPLPESVFGRGFVSKLWVDWSKYRYANGGQTYEVRAPGAEVALGYREASEAHWWAAFAGLAYRHSSISPDDLTNTVRGGMLRPIFQLEGEQTLEQKWRAGAGGSYIAGQKAYWVRGRVVREAWSGLQAGVEAITQGDPNYHANQFGVVLLGFKAGTNVDFGFSVGKRKVQGLDSQSYFGVELGGSY